MATDLSQQIQELVTSTIETSLNGVTLDIAKVLKAPKEALKNKEIVVISSTFVFEKFTTQIRFVIPARTATMIAHAMLMEDTLPLDTISADVADALKESVAQICGALQTIINGASFEDIGKGSFTINDSEILAGDNYQSEGDLVLLSLVVKEDPFEYFIDFDNFLLPFLEEFQKSEILEVVESEEEETKNEENPQVKSQEETPPSSNDDEYTGLEDNGSKQEEPTNDETPPPPPLKEDENIVDDGSTNEELEAALKKNKKIKIAIIALASTIILVIGGFIIMLMLGFFDPQEIKPVENNQTKPTEEELIIADIKGKQIEFKIDMIDTERVNKQLAFLTKYEILEEDVLAQYKQKEAERLHQLKLAALEEFAKNNTEESIYKDANGTTREIKKPSRFEDENATLPQQETNTTVEAQKDELLFFIRIDPKAYKKYQAIIKKEQQTTTQISICKDQKGKIDVYVGPIYAKTILNTIINKAKKVDPQSKKEVEIVSFKRGDFDAMCDF